MNYFNIHTNKQRKAMNEIIQFTSTVSKDQWGRKMRTGRTWGDLLELGIQAGEKALPINSKCKHRGRPAGAATTARWGETGKAQQ